MLSTACDTTEPPCAAVCEADAASWLAICADEAVCCTVAVSCISDATVCCRLLAVCSVRADRSPLPTAISWLAVAMLPLASRTRPTMRFRLSCMAFSAFCRSDTSSLPTTSSCSVRLPLAMASARRLASVSGRQIDTMFSRVSGATTKVVITSASTNSHWVCDATWLPRASAAWAWACSSCSRVCSCFSASTNSAPARRPTRCATVALS